MRKKLLSLLTVLCLVLGMLPATALAAEYADLAADLGYSEEEVAMYIDEDTELSEDVEGLIIVVAPVKVTVKGAKLTTGLLVAPGAKGASVTLGENADVNALIVMDTAEVTVEEKAVAASVTVTAPETKVAVAGEVKTVTVAEEAEKAAVTVAETAKVETVEVSAPAAAVEVAGEVATVAVAETAAAATVTVAETAKVTGDVTNAAPESSVSIKGEVAGSVTTAETAKGATTEVAETAKVTGTVTNAAPDSSMKVEGKVEGGITNTETATGATLEVGEKAEITGEVTDATGEMAVTGDGAANVTVTPAEPAEGDKKDEEEKKDEGDKKDDTTDTDFVTPPEVVGPTVNTVDIGLKPGNLEDHPGEGQEKITNLYDSYSVTTTHSSADPANEYKVVITATGLQNHTNTNNMTYGWVGLAIPKPADGSYTYYMLKVGSGETAEQATPTTTDWTDGSKTYDTFYFAFASGDRHDGSGYTYQLAVFENQEQVSAAAEQVSDFSNAKYLLDVAFEITMDTEQNRQNSSQQAAALTELEEEPEVKDPEVKDPEVKDPEVKDPEVKDPEVK